MNEVRRSSAELLSYENAQAAGSHESVSKVLVVNRIGVTAMTALSLIALCM